MCALTNRSDNLVVLTGVLCGLAVMLVMALYLLAGGHPDPVLDGSCLTDEERDYARSYPLWRALLPWWSPSSACSEVLSPAVRPRRSPCSPSTP